MSDDSSLRLSVLLNVVVVLVAVLIQLSPDGHRIDHEQVRPWGCRTCPIPQPATDAVGTGEGTAAAVARAVARAAPSALCDGDCPGWVEMLLASCRACPAEGAQPAELGS